MANEYTPEELSQLHKELYEILAEIIRVCKKHDISYFIQGGTAIGAFFENAILPWDDDIDIGMTRKNYEKFIKIAPNELDSNYFLQSPHTDVHTPYYFTKVRKMNTLFVEKDFAHIKAHQGIFIDVFPFDKVPDSNTIQKIQRVISNFLNCCFMGKEIWMWKYFGKCEIDNPTNRGPLPCLANRLCVSLLSKKNIYRLLRLSQSMFNGVSSTYYNMVLMPKDHISVHSIENLQEVEFGPLKVMAPSDLETYLNHHYPRLRRVIPKEEQQNHRPTYLSFNTEENNGEK